MTSAETNAAVHETHVGVVILLGDRADKIKKLVRTGFLDFSTTTGHAACAANATPTEPNSSPWTRFIPRSPRTSSSACRDSSASVPIG